MIINITNKTINNILHKILYLIIYLGIPSLLIGTYIYQINKGDCYYNITKYEKSNYFNFYIIQDVREDIIVIGNGGKLYIESKKEILLCKDGKIINGKGKK